MSLVLKNRKVIAVLEKELSILEAIHNLGPCTPFQVNNVLTNSPLLLVMRTMHSLVDKGLLERVTINNQKLYKTRANYKNIRVYFRVNI